MLSLALFNVTHTGDCCLLDIFKNICRGAHTEQRIEPEACICTVGGNEHKNFQCCSNYRTNSLAHKKVQISEESRLWILEIGIRDNLPVMGLG